MGVCNVHNVRNFLNVKRLMPENSSEMKKSLF